MPRVLRARGASTFAQTQDEGGKAIF